MDLVDKSEILKMYEETLDRLESAIKGNRTEYAQFLKGDILFRIEHLLEYKSS